MASREKSKTQQTLKISVSPAIVTAGGNHGRQDTAPPVAQRPRPISACAPSLKTSAATKLRSSTRRPSSQKSQISCMEIAKPCGSRSPAIPASALVGNVAASRSRLAKAFGVTPDKLLSEIQRRLKLEPELIELEQDEAPVQEVVLTGKDADLTKLPAHLQHAYDGAPYISASIDYCVDPRNGDHQLRHAPHHAARPTRSRHRPQRAERSARHLSGRRCTRREAADQLRRRRASDRHAVGDHEIPVDELGLVGSLRGGPCRS